MGLAAPASSADSAVPACHLPGWPDRQCDRFTWAECGACGGTAGPAVARPDRDSRPCGPCPALGSPAGGNRNPLGRLFCGDGGQFNARGQYLFRSLAVGFPGSWFKLSMECHSGPGRGLWYWLGGTRFGGCQLLFLPGSGWEPFFGMLSWCGGFPQAVLCRAA